MIHKTSSDFHDQQIITSWGKNIVPWINAIEKKEIQSRITVTNQAIIKVIQSLKPQTALDIGCGEGWLCREMEHLGIKTLGIDAMPEFIDYAIQQNLGTFQCLAYEELDYSHIQQHFDLLVANFSLLGKSSVEDIFRQAPSLLNHNGQFVIQTIHPDTIKPQPNEHEVWLEGSWHGFNSDFSDPAPWYFRDKKSWIALYKDNHFSNIQVLTSQFPNSSQFASIIYIGEYHGE